MSNISKLAVKQRNYTALEISLMATIEPCVQSLIAGKDNIITLGIPCDPFHHEGPLKNPKENF